MAADKLKPFVQVPCFLFEEGLSPFAILTFAVLLDEANRAKSTGAEIGMRRLERKLGTTRKTVMRATKELERRGLVQVVAGIHSQRNAYEIPILATRTGGGAPPVSKRPPVALRPQQPVALRPTTGGPTTPEPVAESHHDTDQTSSRLRTRGAAAPRKARAPDPIWDVVLELWYSEGIPKQQRSRVGMWVKALKDLKATPEEIRVRHGRAIEWYERKRATVKCVVEHWSELKNDSSGRTTHRPGRVESGPGEYDDVEPFSLEG